MGEGFHFGFLGGAALERVVSAVPELWPEGLQGWNSDGRLTDPFDLAALLYAAEVVRRLPCGGLPPVGRAGYLGFCRALRMDQAERLRGLALAILVATSQEADRPEAAPPDPGEPGGPDLLAAGQETGAPHTGLAELARQLGIEPEELWGRMCRLAEELGVNVRVLLRSKRRRELYALLAEA